MNVLIMKTEGSKPRNENRDRRRGQRSSDRRTGASLTGRGARSRIAGLNDQNRGLLALLAVCWYLTLGPLLTLLLGQHDVRNVDNWLRAMPGDAGRHRKHRAAPGNNRGPSPAVKAWPH